MITEDSESKANKFLKELMGDDNYKELKDNGKVEIKSGKFTYELHGNGIIINKTLNQKYCVIPSRDSISYPPSDILAIKWMYLNYNHDLIEKVANRTNLNIIGCENFRTSISQDQRTETSTYNEFIHYMECNGWRREEIQINKQNTNLVTIYDIDHHVSTTVNVNSPSGGQISITGTSCCQNLLDIRCPAGLQMSTKGMYQVDTNRGEDRRDADRFELVIKDTEGREIDDATSIRIEKFSTNELYTGIWNGQYRMLNDLFRWERGFILRGGEILRVSVVSTRKIDSKNVKVLMDADVWSRGL